VTKKKKKFFFFEVLHAEKRGYADRDGTEMGKWIRELELMGFFLFIYSKKKKRCKPA